MAYCGFASNAQMLEAPVEVLEVPHGLLRPRQSEDVIGGFDLWRISPGAVELGSWVHVDFTGRGYATACAKALTQAGLALPDVARVEIHTDEANAIGAAIPRRQGYRLDRVDELPPELPAHSGRLQTWGMERPSADCRSC
jgi:RimJ/RimL family protein N-acetyltransferase